MGTVLEDDFCFEANPDFGLTELDENLPYPFHYLHFQRDLGMNSRLRVLATYDKLNRINETPLGTVGYVIERSLAHYILQKHSICETPIDHLLTSLASQGIFYQTRKPIVGTQEDLASDIHSTTDA